MSNILGLMTSQGVRPQSRFRPPSAGTRRWLCLAVITLSASSVVLAQVEPDAPREEQTADISGRVPSEPAQANSKLVRKFDLSRVGKRGIGGGFNVYSVEKEQRLGQKLAAAIDRTARKLSDPVALEYLNQLGQRLSRLSDNHLPLTVKIVESDEPNIFSLPGGILYLTTGLMRDVDNEAELAGLISHEIAHIAARHATKGASRRKLWSFVSRPAMFLGPFGILAWQFGDVTVPLKLSRDAELEADLLGLQYMYLAGYDPSEFLRFMERVYVVEDRRPSRMALMFSEYPSLEVRLRRDRAVISTLPPRVEYMVDTSTFAEVKAKFTFPEPELRRGKGSNGPRLRRRTQ